MLRRLRLQATPPLFSIGTLPLAGSNDMFTSVRAFEAVWRHTLYVLDGIRTGPLELPLTLRMSLDSLRDFAAGILTSVQGFQRSGGASGDVAGDIPNVRGLVDRFLGEIITTKRLWNAFVEGHQDVVLGDDIGLGFGADTPLAQSSEQAVIDATKPQTIPESLLLLAGGALTIGILWALRR